MKSMWLGVVVLAVGAGCSNSATPVHDLGGVADQGGGGTGGVDQGVPDQGGNDQSMVITMSIADARSMNVTTPFTTTAVVTAVRGDDPADTKEWYLQDPAGGPNSGVAVYCNKTAKSNPCPMSI